MAIYLDANILYGLSSRSLEWRTLRAIAQAHRLEIVIPEIALNEAVRNRREEVAAKSLAIQNAIDRAQGLFDVPAFRAPNPARVADQWRTDILTGVQFLSARPDHAFEALNREVNRIAPTHDGKGARDAAIWLAVRDDYRSRTEPAYFVSGNHKDFGEPPDGRLHVDLRMEVDQGQPFFYVHKISELLPHLAMPGGKPWTPRELESVRGLRMAVTTRMDDLSAGFETLNELIQSAFGRALPWTGARTSLRDVGLVQIAHQDVYQLPRGQEVGVLQTRWMAFVDISLSGPRNLIDAGFRDGLGAVTAEAELWARRSKGTGEQDFMLTGIDRVEVTPNAYELFSNQDKGPSA